MANFERSLRTPPKYLKLLGRDKPLPWMKATLQERTPPSEDQTAMRELRQAIAEGTRTP